MSPDNPDYDHQDEQHPPTNNGTKSDARSEIRMLLHNHSLDTCFNVRARCGSENAHFHVQHRISDNCRLYLQTRLSANMLDVSILIGRGGVNIKALREEQKTIIQLPDSHGPERLLIIKGGLDSCALSLKSIFNLLGKDRRFDRGEADCRLLIHQSHAGPFIGHSGDHVKELRKQFELDIKVFSRRCPMSTDRIVLLKGPVDNVIDCIVDTIKLTESHPIKGLNQPYDPFNADDFLAEEYGGFADERRMRDSRNMANRSSGNSAETLMRMLPHPWGIRSNMDDSGSKRRRISSPERNFPPFNQDLLDGSFDRERNNMRYGRDRSPPRGRQMNRSRSNSDRFQR